MMTRSLICVLAISALVAMPVLAQESAPAPSPSAPAASPAAPSPSLTPANPSEVPTVTPSVSPTPTTKPGGGQPGCGELSNPWVMIPLMIAFILLYIWMGRGRRKQEKARKDMLSNLKKGDKITTIGGIVGTVVEVRENEVTVKTDESNNVRMKFARWAIRDVGEPGQAPEGEKK